jgi:hypothetical protein
VTNWTAGAEGCAFAQATVQVVGIVDVENLGLCDPHGFEDADVHGRVGSLEEHRR